MGDTRLRDKITIKSAAQLDMMREAGALVARVLTTLAVEAKPGVSTAALDQIAEGMVRDAGAIPSFKGYRGFPASICASINEEIVHGIPSPRRVLQAGDLLSVDFGAIVNGWHGDAAVTIPVGEVAPESRHLLETTRDALYLSIAMSRPGNTIGHVGAVVEAHARAHGYTVVREYCGHGIGRQMHEEPAVPNHGKPGKGTKLLPGMAIAIEPMLLMGAPTTHVEPDGWTVRTADRRLSAHFEHSVAVTEDGPAILTQLPDDPEPERRLAAAMATLAARPPTSRRRWRGRGRRRPAQQT